MRGAVVVLLGACAAAPRATSAERPHGADAGVVTTTDDAGPTSCVADAKDVGPCLDDCNRGIASACATFAARLERGDGVTRDTSRAVALHERACDLRETASCIAAAHMHAIGAGVSPNRAKQMDLLAAACRLGDATACGLPAKAFASGAGVPRDDRRARELLEHACAGGVEKACEALSDGGAP